MTANGSCTASAAIITAWFVPHGFTRPSGTVSALGQVVQLLKDELDGDAPAEALGRKDLAELLLEGVADDENHLAETGADRVVDRISR